jgi:hypothetical protein
MADDFKKPSAPPAGGGDATTELVTMLFILVAAFFMARAIYNRLVEFLGGNPGDVLSPQVLREFIWSLPLSFKLISFAVSAVAIAGIVHLLRGLTDLNRAEYARLYPIPEKEVSDFAEPEVLNKKWRRVQEHLESTSQSDWKLAILEADIMLDEMLEVMGYRGETMSDKLKSVEPSDFLTLNLAWEAHKIRNSIAHEGADFMIDHREAKRVIALYEQVFQEFEFI